METSIYCVFLGVAATNQVEEVSCDNHEDDNQEDELGHPAEEVAEQDDILASELPDASKVQEIAPQGQRGVGQQLGLEYCQRFGIDFGDSFVLLDLKRQKDYQESTWNHEVADAHAEVPCLHFEEIFRLHYHPHCHVDEVCREHKDQT